MSEEEISDFVACKRCGWVHFTRSRSVIEEEVASFNAAFDRFDVDAKLCYWYLPEGEREDFRLKPMIEQHAFLERAKSSVDRYVRCFRCGAPYTEMRPAFDEDCPAGSTVQPIMRVDPADAQPAS
jgi:DNA-directed RNA polymerase subunit RPC12/RpoP